MSSSPVPHRGGSAAAEAAKLLLGQRRHLQGLSEGGNGGIGGGGVVHKLLLACCKALRMLGVLYVHLHGDPREYPLTQLRRAWRSCARPCPPPPAFPRAALWLRPAHTHHYTTTSPTGPCHPFHATGMDPWSCNWRPSGSVRRWSCLLRGLNSPRRLSRASPPTHIPGEPA